MKPEEIRTKWINDFRKWKSYDKKQLEDTGLNNCTIEFLKCGFFLSAAPFINFNEYPEGERFTNIVDFFKKYNHQLEADKKRFIVFGSDSGGNIIGFDIEDNDRIVLLDHEMDFVKIMDINKNIYDLAMSILLYNDFITKIQIKYGDEAFLDRTFANYDVEELIKEFNTYNENILKESDFWATEINTLKREIKTIKAS